MKAIIFDLDGTLTDTLADLHASTNHALRTFGMPERSLDEVRQFVGNGVRNLMRRAVVDGDDNPQFEECFSEFKRYYVMHCQDNTCLYPGINDLLQALKQRGIQMAVVSNKLQAGVDELHKRWFAQYIDVAIGEHDGVERKPAPDMLLEAMQRLGVNNDECMYVGDSDVDILTARNAGVPCISVLWGFRDKEFLIEHGAETLCEHPMHIIDIIENKK